MSDQRLRNAAAHSAPLSQPPWTRRRWLGTTAVLAAGGLPLWSGAAPAGACPTLLNHTFPRLQDEVPQSLCQYAGRVVLVVNTASYCGFTKQYDGLEALYDRLAPRGLVILGFPSNDFGAQEPGSNQEIADFCTNTYAIKFPMFAKSNVSGDEANPLFRELTRLTGTRPKWNFYKYLIDRQGRAVEAYSSMTAPDSRDLVSRIEALL